RRTAGPITSAKVPARGFPPRRQLVAPCRIFQDGPGFLPNTAKSVDAIVRERLWRGVRWLRRPTGGIKGRAGRRMTGRAGESWRDPRGRLSLPAGYRDRRRTARTPKVMVRPGQG